MPILFLALLQVTPPVATPAPPPTASPAPLALSPEEADERCLAALAYQASAPGQSALPGRYGELFFYGKLMSRDPGIDLGAGLRRAVVGIGAEMPAEVVRCTTEVEAASHAMAAAGTAARGAAPATATPTR